MDIKTFERLFELKNELDAAKRTIETLTNLQCQAERLRKNLACEQECCICREDRYKWKAVCRTPLQYISLVADDKHHYEYALSEEEWNAIVLTAIEIKQKRIKEIEDEIKKI